MNLNKVLLIGRLTADPQLRTTTGGQPVASFSIATNRVWTDRQGAKQQDVQFHNIVVWGRQAEIANQFLKKGSMAYIEGRLQTRNWQDKQGQNRWTTEVICERMQLGPRGGEGGGTFPRDENQQQDNNAGKDAPAEEDLPEINIDEERGVNPKDIPF